MGRRDTLMAYSSIYTAILLRLFNMDKYFRDNSYHLFIVAKLFLLLKYV